jgi:cobalt-zinc-cadmium resistance protein CzcA
MRRGEQSTPTIQRVEQLVHAINHSTILPPGVHIERIYDRKDLIDLTTHTVLHNMVVGILLIVLLQWIFLGDLRSALIVGATIPFALFFAVIILVLRGQSAVGWRDRFRADRGRHRHHGRGDLPPPDADH